jgi:hypothetical protein
MPKNNLIIAIVLTIVAGGSGFFAGAQYQNGQKSPVPAGMARRSGDFAKGPGGNASGGKVVSGEVTAVDTESLTVKTQDGSSKIILYSSSTKINKSAEGSASDLKSGTQVMVTGSTGSDGTVTAQTISVGNAGLPQPPAN